MSIVAKLVTQAPRASDESRATNARVRGEGRANARSASLPGRSRSVHESLAHFALQCRRPAARVAAEDACSSNARLAFRFRGAAPTRVRILVLANTLPKPENASSSSPSISPHRRSHAQILLRGVDLIEDDEGEHGVGRDADVIGGEPGVKLERAAGRHRLPAAVQETLERHGSVRKRLLLLKLGLDVIEGEGEERSE